MKKLIKILKWFFIVLTTVIIWLFITIYISSLNSYTESDFNIPKDFFKTKYADKDPFSKENWFNDLVDMSNALTIKGDRINTESWTLDKDINLWYFNILWNCIFDEKYEREKKCEDQKKNYFFDLIYEHDSSIDKKIALINNNPEKVKKLFDQKYIKLQTTNVNNIKEFYSLINIKNINLEIEKLNKQIKDIKKRKNENINYKDNDYIFDYTKKRSIYRRYKILIDKINEQYKNIKTIADIWKTINDINSNNDNNKQKKDFITKQLNDFYCYSYIYCTISISDFKQYNNDLYYFNNTTKEKIISISLEKLKILSKNINEKYEKKIMNKWYILWNWENRLIHDGYSYIQDFYSSKIYLANTYLKKWDYEKWINILLNNKKFINYLINKSDWTIYTYPILIAINKLNLSALNYSISNYKLDIKSKEKIINTLKEKVELWWFRNWLKRSYIELKKSLDQYSIKPIKYFFSNKISTKIHIFIYNNILYKLFYSPNETKLILKKNFFNILTKNSEFKVNLNINNYLWRDYYNKNYKQLYNTNEIIKKEKYNQKLREDLFNQVTKSIKEDKKQILEENKSLNKINIKDLWNWFELKQMKNASLLIYKWSTIYLWSHITKKSPFIWDEWCEKLFTKLNNNIGKQQAWDSLSKNEQKLCMKEYLNRSISVKTTNDTRFYIIKKQNYESSNILLYDVKNKNIKKWKFWDNISKIESKNNKTYILHIWSRGCYWGIILLKDKKETILFSNNCDVDLNNIPNDYKKIIDFELLWDWSIKVIYNWWKNRERKELIIK